MSLIEVRNLSYSFPGAASAGCKAISDISFAVEKGEFLGITGPSGGGKTTLLRLLAGLLRPSAGQIVTEGRLRISMAFQFPEHQLFEQTVLKDVMYGPLNMGLDASSAEERAIAALKDAGLGDENLYARSPFRLSGGEKRRTALAGILAMDPDVLLLDEPACALDPAGHDMILKCIASLNRQGKTVVMVSHDPEDLAAYCSRIKVLEEGKMTDLGKSAEVFGRNEPIRPEAMEIAEMLRKSGCCIAGDIFDAEELINGLSEALLS
ncbi:MAG: ATP-binding cassette domain-containing protein [Spirochaetales bacterium]|nr:ATP-binding cassette domain-containing protein [Spirochaetales bacterium]